MLPAFRLAASLCLAAPLLALAACGASSSQHSSNDGCAALNGRSSAEAIRDAVACYGATLSQDEAAAMCRTVRDVANRADAVGLRDAALCVLGVDERSDGAWLAELIAAVADRSDAVDGLIEAMGLEFDASVHGNTFTAGLTRQAQHALGERLEGLPPELRAALVSIALQYALVPLSDYAAPYLRELAPTDDAVLQFTATIPNRAQADETERWALAASGEWSPEQILNCFERDGICTEWEGESPLMLLEVAPAQREVTPAPDAGVRMLRLAEADQAELDAVARWLARGEYPHVDMILPTLQTILTDTSAPLASRNAIAQATSPRICAPAAFNDLVQRVHFSDRSSLFDVSSPWAVFVGRCAATWGAPDALHVLGTSSWLNVPESVIDAIRARVAAGTEQSSCEEIAAMANTAAAATSRIPSSAMVWVEVARAAGDRCAEDLLTEVVNVADDRDAHPLATLSAGLWLRERGDRRGCAAIQRADAYHDDNDPHAPGPVATALRETLDELCN